jgi:hypothetical protein
MPRHVPCSRHFCLRTSGSPMGGPDRRASALPGTPPVCQPVRFRPPKLGSERGGLYAALGVLP